MKKEIKKEYLQSTIKGAIGAIPFAGTLLNEVMFEARSRVKQERVNNFVNELSSYLANLKEGDLKLEDLNQEEIGDILEDVFISVSKTSAKHKYDSFKKIIRKQLDPVKSNSDEVLRFVSITNSINAFQFQILTFFSSMSDKVLKYPIDILEIERELPLVEQEIMHDKKRYNKGLSNNLAMQQSFLKDKQRSINSKRKALSENIRVNDHSVYGLTLEEFIVEMQDLIGKGLIFDQAINTNIVKPYSYFGLTKLGRKYIEYVREDNKL